MAEVPNDPSNDPVNQTNTPINQNPVQTDNPITGDVTTPTNTSPTTVDNIPTATELNIPTQPAANQANIDPAPTPTPASKLASHPHPDMNPTPTSQTIPTSTPVANPPEVSSPPPWSSPTASTTPPADVNPQTPEAPTAQSEAKGPPWLRTDPNVRAAQDQQIPATEFNNTPPSATPTNLSANIPGTVPEAPLPWQIPSEKASFDSQVVETGDDGHHGGFPLIVFVIIILGIVVAIIAFLFTQGALPFLS